MEFVFYKKRFKITRIGSRVTCLPTQHTSSEEHRIDITTSEGRRIDVMTFIWRLSDKVCCMDWM